MSPIYDAECIECGKIEEDLWLKMDEEPTECSCGGKRKKHVGGRFKLVYNNKKDLCTWGDDGYSSSQYWRLVKEARDRGEKVKGINEDG